MSDSKTAVVGIDHLIVMVRDLDNSLRLWQALGFAPTPRGFHATGGTANHLIMLDRTYIELLGMADPRSESPYRAMIEQAPGLWGIAFRGSADETFRYWQERELNPAAPTSLAREVEIAGRLEQARFRLTMLERTRNLPFLLFCCEQLTPQFVWQPGSPAHPNGARALQEVIVVMNNEDIQEQFERVAGRPVTRVAPGSGQLAFEDSRISFLSEGAFGRRFGHQADLRPRIRPSLAGFVLRTADLDQARAFAQAAGWHLRDSDSGGFLAQVPDDGVVIEWTP